eukprot:COSAG02_NODE_4840_length_4918_cov_35.030712_2_plen_237_part_00
MDGAKAPMAPSHRIYRPEDQLQPGDPLHIGDKVLIDPGADPQEGFSEGKVVEITDPDEYVVRKVTVQYENGTQETFEEECINVIESVQQSTNALRPSVRGSEDQGAKRTLRKGLRGRAASAATAGNGSARRSETVDGDGEYRVPNEVAEGLSDAEDVGCDSRSNDPVTEDSVGAAPARDAATVTVGQRVQLKYEIDEPGGYKWYHGEVVQSDGETIDIRFVRSPMKSHWPKLLSSR